MAQTVNVIIPSENRERLLAIANDRSRRLKHIQSARIVLFSAERLPVLEVARRAGVSRPAVGAGGSVMARKGWRVFCALRRASPADAPLSAAVVAEVLALTYSEPLDEATHSTGRAMAKAVGISLRAVQRLWDAHRLQPHCLRTFKRWLPTQRKAAVAVHSVEAVSLHRASGAFGENFHQSSPKLRRATTEGNPRYLTVGPEPIQLLSDEPLAGEALRERELTSDRHRQKNYPDYALASASDLE